MSAARKSATSAGMDPQVAKAIEAAHQSLDYLRDHAQLQTLHLCGSTFRIQPRFYEIAQKQDAMALGFTLQNVGLEYDPTKGLATLLMEWRMFAEDVSAPEDSAERRVLEIVAGYLAQYGSLGDQPRATVLSFLDQLAEFASYPYFRAQVAQLTWSAGIQIPVLPVISTNRRAPRAPAVGSKRSEEAPGEAKP